MPNTRKNIPLCELLLKLGGRALSRALDQKDFFRPLKSLGGRAIVVHGGGASINEWAEKFGIQSQFIKGQRVTTPELLEVVQAALCGQLNPKLAWRLEALDIPAVGLSGVSASLLKCEVENPELGLVGRVVDVNTGLLRDLLAGGWMPVIAPIGILPNGSRCNVNADLAACGIASSLKVSKLVFLSDQEGILDAQGKKISELTIAELEKLETNGTIKGGMFVKSRAVKEFLDANPSGSVFIANGMDDAVLPAILKGDSPGTRIIGGH